MSKDEEGNKVRMSDEQIRIHNLDRMGLLKEIMRLKQTILKHEKEGR